MKTSRWSFLRAVAVAAAITVALLTSSLAFKNASGQEPQLAVNVAFGGFAFSGRAADIHSTYPAAAALEGMKTNGVGFISRQILDFFKRRAGALKGIQLDFDKAQIEQTPLVLAVGMTEEQVLQEQFGDFTKLVVELGFELLVLDFVSKEVVSSQPIFIELRDASKSGFGPEQIQERVRGMLEGPRSQLLTVLAQKCEALRIGGKNQGRLRITKVAIGEKALPFLSQTCQAHPEGYAHRMAQEFGALLCAKAGLCLLPYQKDALNTGRMALAFADGSVVDFVIPESSLSVDLNLRGFRKALYGKTAAEAVWSYAAYLDVRCYEPTFQKTVYEASFKKVRSKAIPSSQEKVDEPMVVSEVLKDAFLEAVEGIQKAKTTRPVLRRCEL